VELPAAARFDSVVIRAARNSPRSVTSAIQSSGGAATVRVRVYANQTAPTQRLADTVIVEALGRVRGDTLRLRVPVRLVPGAGAP
jgi:hypothetical protein